MRGPETRRAARPNRGAALENPEPTRIVTRSPLPRQRRGAFPSPSLRVLLEAGALARFLGLEESRAAA